MVNSSELTRIKATNTVAKMAFAVLIATPFAIVAHF